MEKNEFLFRPKKNARGRMNRGLESGEKNIPVDDMHEKVVVTGFLLLIIIICL